ncbi:helix-turn-helix domain-containing protein [Paenibacillus faecalis]|uniref:helix-turn-helix domain-containing protein n=1 Tax=Paenibacillus faecalis TaxID=2079532 RepID=UPI000D0FFF05|nr:helix-turn-helix domain-containing protein [Paenibacillus faecalis]
MEKEFMLASQLLTMLDSEDRWFTLAEIEEQIGVSDKTIRKLIDETKKELPPSIKIEISRGKGVLLQYERRNIAIGEVISAMFRQKTFFQLFDLLFAEGGRYSLEELADKLFMSSSSLKKFIIRLNNSGLKHYNLRLTYAAPDLKGKEVNIRYFYWRLYYDAYEFSGWPFPNIDDSIIHQLITDVEADKDIVYFLNSKRGLSFWAAIIITRTQMKKYVTVPYGKYDWKNNMFHISMIKLAEALEQHFSVHLPQDEIRFFQALFSHNQYNYYDEAKKAAMLSIEKEKLTRLTEEKYQMVNHFLMFALEAYPAIDATDRLIWEISEFFEKMLVENAIPDFVYISTSSLTEYVKRECQPMYQGIWACMNRLGQIYPEIMYNEYHLTKLTLLVSSSLRYKSKKAFLLIGEEFSIRHYVAKLIKQDIGDELTINTSILEELTDEQMQQHGIDFVISNFPVELKTVPIVIISTIPTKRDLDNIRKELM